MITMYKIYDKAIYIKFVVEKIKYIIYKLKLKNLNLNLV